MMFLADITLDSSSILGAAGIIASGIGGGISVATKIYVNYRKERDDLERTQKEDHIKREEQLANRADEREKLVHSYYKDTIDKFLKIAETSVSIQVSLAAKVEALSKNIDGWDNKLNAILSEQQQRTKQHNHTSEARKQ